jgi:hypothetical protein
MQIFLSNDCAVSSGSMSTEFFYLVQFLRWTRCKGANFIFCEISEFGPLWWQKSCQLLKFSCYKCVGTVEPLKIDHDWDQRNWLVLRGFGNRSFRSTNNWFRNYKILISERSIMLWLHYLCMFLYILSMYLRFATVFKCILNKNKYCRNLFYKRKFVLIIQYDHCMQF